MCSSSVLFICIYTYSHTVYLYFIYINSSLLFKLPFFHFFDRWILLQVPVNRNLNILFTLCPCHGYLLFVYICKIGYLPLGCGVLNIFSRALSGCISQACVLNCYASHSLIRSKQNPSLHFVQSLYPQHICSGIFIITLQWRHNDCNGASNHRRLEGLLDRLFGRRSKKTSKLHLTGPVTGEFPAPRASIWWRHHGIWSLVNSL